MPSNKTIREFQNAHHAWGVGEQTARDEARLFDACLALGMSRDEPSVSAWAARRAFEKEAA